MTGKTKQVKTAEDKIFPSENFLVITQLLLCSIYVLHKKDVSQSS